MGFLELLPRVLALGVFVLATGGCALNDGGSSNRSTSGRVVSQVTQNPYEAEDVLVYAPLPLTVEEAIEHYVGMDQPRTDLSDAGKAFVVAELVADFEAQTGASAEQPYTGDGTQWIAIDG